MNRREFLKGLGLLGVAASLPLGLMDARAGDNVPGFDPGVELSDRVMVSDFIDQHLFKQVKEHLDPSLKKQVPSSYWHRVEWFIRQPSPTFDDPLALRGVIGWRYIPPN